MQLGFGVTFPDLYEREGLIKVDRAFVAFLTEADRSLAEKLAAARAAPPSGRAESDLLGTLMYGLWVELCLEEVQHGRDVGCALAGRKLLDDGALSASQPPPLGPDHQHQG